MWYRDWGQVTHRILRLGPTKTSSSNPTGSPMHHPTVTHNRAAGTSHQVSAPINTRSAAIALKAASSSESRPFLNTSISLGGGRRPPIMGRRGTPASADGSYSS